MPEDIAKALANWRKMVVISGDDDIKDPIVVKKLEGIVSKAEKALAAFDKNREGSPLVEDEVVTTADMVTEFAQVDALAAAWGSCGSKYYHDEGVLEKILFSLEWLNQHRYGRNEIEGHGWRNMKLFNWHSWEVGVPINLERTLMILGDKVSAEDCKRYLEVFDYRVPHARDYGANKVHYGMLISGSGLLKNDPEQVQRGLDEIEDTYEYADGGNNDWQGFYTDGSYIFHTRHPMNATYGRVHFSSLIQIYKIYKGTRFEREGLAEKLRHWATLTFLPFVHNGVASKSVLGRHPVGGVGSGAAILKSCCELLCGAGDSDYRRIAAEIKANVVGGGISPDDILSGISAEAGKEFRKIMLDESVPSGYSDSCRAFYNEDRMIYRHGKVAFSLAMSSSRIYDYECINHQNMNGWYGGDGMLTVYGKNTETYKDYWNNVDPYRYPGVTLDTRERIEQTIAQANEFLSSEDYVGGLSDGKCGLASMNFESYHSDGKLVSSRFYSPDGSYGFPPVARECTLKGYKSWFFNNGIAVCLGCNINANDNAEVITVVDSRKTADGSLIEVMEDGVCISDFGCYYFPDDHDFKVEVHKRNGVRFCDIILSHGVDPSDTSYSYIILPDFSREEFESFKKHAFAGIAANDKSVQAVVFEDGTEEYAFRESVCINGITVSQPALVMKKEKTISAADPTHKLDSVVVGYNGAEYAFDLRNSYGKTITKEL